MVVEVNERESDRWLHDECDDDDDSDNSSHKLMMPVPDIDCRYLYQHLHHIIDLLLSFTSTSTIITTTIAHGSIQHRLHELLQASECIIIIIIIL